MITTKKLRDMGYTCQLETVKGQGYFGGDGVQAYRVRDPQGKLVNYPISTHRTARAAWEEAADRIQSGRSSNRAGGKRTAKHRNRSAHTRAPVTVSGWYEHSDGTIGHYVWRGGSLVLDQVVPSWSDVESAKSEALSLPPMNYAGGKRTAKRSSNRAGTKRRATKKTANKAGKRRNRAGRTTNPIAIVQDMPQGHYVASSHYTQKAAVAAARKRGASTVLEVPENRLYQAIWYVVIPKV